MNCVILQPSYLPWRGYFHQIREAEVCWDHDWPRKHAATLRHLYSGAPHFERYSDLLFMTGPQAPDHIWGKLG